LRSVIRLGRGYLFIHHGSFSGVNVRLAAELATHFQPALPAIDLKDARRIAPGTVLNAPLPNLWHSLREFHSPRAAVKRRLFTRYMFEHRTGLARESARELRPDFIFQTQTIFDASGTAPTFIYTDHTVLANQRYAWPGARSAAHPRWVDLENETYQRASAIYVSSRFAADSLIEQYLVPAERVLVVGSGTNLAVPERLPERARPVRHFLFLGLEWERKGGPQLVEAFRRTRERHPDIRLTIAGASPDIREQSVEVLGRVAPESVPGLLSDADVFVMPSLQEPSAGVYLEASAYGLPILATTVGGTPDRVLHGQTGLLSAPGNVEELQANAEALIADPAAAAAMGRAGHELIAERFTWRRVGSMIADDICRRLRLA
jgi:glycosyltransferase involved in cell wall biosynthesis